MSETGSAAETQVPEADYARLNSQPLYRMRAPSCLIAAAWTFWAVMVSRAGLRRRGLRAVRAPRPPRLPWGSRNGVYVVLRRLSPTCLERSVVMQTWLASHDVFFDVVVGVNRGEADVVKAHAWIAEITAPSDYADFTPIHRIPAR